MMIIINVNYMQHIVEGDTNIASISITDCACLKTGYTIYTLHIVGRTRFMLQCKYTLQPTSYCLKVRYSEMLQLHRALSIEFAQYCSNNHKIMPIFPPKKFFNNTNKDFLNKRMKELNQYFINLYELLPNLSSSASLIQFCKPIKMDIIVCGGHSSGKSLFLERLLFLLEKNVENDLCFSSSPAKLNSYSNKRTIDSDETETQNGPPMINHLLKAVRVSPFLRQIDCKQSYLNLLPVDTVYHDLIFRIDMEEQSLSHNMTKAIFSNLISMWIENNAAMVVAIDLSNYGSFEIAQQTIGVLKHLIEKKLKPLFVVVGILNSLKQREVSGDDINHIILEKPLCSLPIKYIEVDIITGDNIIEALNYLLWAREKKEFD